MNVIISNKYKNELDNLEIEVSKKLDGEFEVEEIIDTFSNYFFNKMIIDITAIKNYQNLSTLQKLSVNLNVEKIIFLLDKDNVNPSFLSQLVSIGIYNFTSTIDGVNYLYNNPNSYRDVVQYQDSSFMINNNSNSNESIKINKDENINSNNYSFDTYSNDNIQDIIGIKNITSGAGATTLTYLLKNVLENYKDVVAIEVNKKDFIFLRDNSLISTDSKNLKNEIAKHQSKDVILIDLNSYEESNICTDIIYLIEPTTIKLNKMIMLDRSTFDKLRGKKIILNKCLLEKKDIASFELESNSKVYYSIPPLDDKKDNSSYILPLLNKLNLLNIDIDDDNNSSSDKFFRIFNK